MDEAILIGVLYGIYWLVHKVAEHKESKLVSHHIRWAHASDFLAMVEIAQGTFEAWELADFQRCDKLPNVYMLVVEHYGKVVAFVVYKAILGSYRVFNLSTHIDHRRKGYATALINYVKNKLRAERRKGIVVITNESNLPAQLFWSKQGFKAVKVMRDYFEGLAADGYKFVYTEPYATKELAHGSSV
jgi:ribosomal protein S18 acetylase RimI-like enzyme